MRWVFIVLGALVLLVAWLVAILWPELRWVADWVTAGVVLVVLLVFLVRWVRARLKAAALERELLKAQPATVERPEVVELRAQMRKAFQALKARSGARKNPLYDLPWYAIVGPPAAGKTTALQHSGLTFLSSDPSSPKMRGAAGTRNCDWWISSEAILLDTAGRYATSGEDREEWLAFLDTLHRLRPARPLDGLLVAVSVTEVASGTDAQREELAAKLRERTDEILERLEMVVPVYLLLTKADLVAGFVESMSDLSKPQRAQVWGASFEVRDPRLAEPARAIEEEISGLAEVIHSRLLDRLPAERHPARRARLMQFPLEFRALSAPLGQFVESLCRPGADGESPLFRGFYLTSGTQVGRPVDRVLSGMVRGFDLAPGASGAATSAGEVHSYFLADAFRAVMFRDRDLAVRSAASVERRSRRELRLALAAIGAAAFVMLPAFVSYIRNMQLAGAVDAATASVTPSEPGTRGDPVETMSDLLVEVDRDASGFGIPGWFGPRAARSLAGPLRSAYLARLHSEFIGRVRPQLETRLRAVSTSTDLGDAPATPDDRTPLGDAYETVKLFSILVSPAGHVSPSWGPEQLTRIWQAVLPPSDSVPEGQLVEHAKHYLAAMAIDSRWAWRPSPFLAAARDRLRRSDVRGVPYRRTLLWAGDVPPLRASDAFSALSLEFLGCRGDVQVPGPFTANGWEKVRAALDSSAPWPEQAVIDSWVVDDAGIPADAKALRAQVRSQYFDDYTRHWMTFLDELKVKTPPNLTAVRAELAALKESEGLYKTLFALLKANAIHDAPPDSPVTTAEGLLGRLSWFKADAGVLQKDVGPSPVEKSFRPFLLFRGDPDLDKAAAGAPSRLDKYLLILEKLKAALDSPNPECKTLGTEAITGADALLDGVGEPTHSRLRRLLMPPVEGSVAVCGVVAGGANNDEWNASVYSTYHAQLFDHFPFKRSGPPANFADVAAFFRPKSGVLWAFVETKLADRVEPGGAGGYVMKPGAAPLAPSVLPVLANAQEITDALFAPGDPEAGFRFSFEVDWSATDVTDAKLWIGAKSTPLPRGTWAGPLKWADEEVKLEWVQAGHLTQEIGRHTWSLLDLFKQIGGLSPLGGGRGDTYVAEFPPLEIKVRSAGKVDAFRPNLFSKFWCPEQIEVKGP